MTTALQEDFVRTFHEPQIPTFPQVYGPETTGRSHVIVALDVLCLGHMKFPGSSGPVGNHTARRAGLHNVSKMFGPVRAHIYRTEPFRVRIRYLAILW